MAEMAWRKWVTGRADLSQRHQTLVDRPIIATLCTHGTTNPMLSAVWFEWINGGISCSVPPDGVIARNVNRNSWVALLIAGADRPYCGIEYRGDATLGDDYMPVLTRLAVKYLGKAAGAEYLVGHPPNVVVRMERGRFRFWDDKS